MQYTDFTYTDAEATITAKWQVGVRNYTLPLAFFPFAVVLFVELLKWAEVIRLPYMQFQPLHFAAAALYILFILFVFYRIYSTATSLKKRQLALSFDGNTVVVKTGETSVYVTRYEDIKAIDYGDTIIRIQSDYGAYCLPARLVPNDFVSSFEGRDDVIIKRHRWM